MELQKLNPKALDVRKPANPSRYPWLTQKVIDTLKQIDPQLLKDDASDTDLCELLIDLNETYVKYYEEQPDAAEQKPANPKWLTPVIIAQLEKMLGNDTRSETAAMIAIDEYITAKKLIDHQRKKSEKPAQGSPEPQG